MQTFSNNNVFAQADWLSGVTEFNADYVDFEKNLFVERSDEDSQEYLASTIANLTRLNISNILIGRNTYKLNSGMFSPNIIIGRYCSISHYVNIGGTHHNYNFLSTSFPDDDCKSPNYTIIGCDVWIGINATIIGGAKIGHGAVIGAGAVIKNDVPPYSIVAGNRAKVVKMRFSDEIVSDLLDLKWWTLPPEIIKQLPYKDIRHCIALLKEIRKSESSVAALY